VVSPLGGKDLAVTGEGRRGGDREPRFLRLMASTGGSEIPLSVDGTHWEGEGGGGDD